MRRIGVRELRANTGSILRDLANGETFEITKHGYPVGHLIPANSDAWASLIASKEVTPASAEPAAILGQPPRTYGHANPLDTMRQDER